MRWFAILLLIILPFASLAQPLICEPTRKLYKSLTSIWGEIRAATGTINGNDKVFLEIWQSKKTYTIFVSNVQGVSCVILVGENLEWKEIAVEKDEALDESTP